MPVTVGAAISTAASNDTRPTEAKASRTVLSATAVPSGTAASQMTRVDMLPQYAMTSCTCLPGYSTLADNYRVGLTPARPVFAAEWPTCADYSEATGYAVGNAGLAGNFG